MIVVDLIYNLSLLVAMSVVSGFIGQRWRQGRWGPLLQGLVFGCATVIGMLRPLVLGPGLIFDGRSVMISLCGLFFGPTAVGVAGGMAATCRVIQGGVGTPMGVLVIVASALLGLVVHSRWTRQGAEPSTEQLLGLGLVVHVVMLMLVFTLPSGMPLPVLERIGLPVLLTYPLATVLIGRILGDQVARIASVEALRESAQRFRALIDHAPFGVFIADEDGRYVEVNSAACRITGYSVSELLELRVVDLLLPESRDAGADHFRGVAETGSARGEMACRHKEGRTLSLSVDAVRLSPTRFIGFVSDLTHRKQAEAERVHLEEQIRQAQKMDSIGRLAGGVAHDLNNLLTPILGYGELLMERLAHDANGTKAVEVIVQAGERARDLVQQLLAFSRKQVLAFQSLDLNRVVRNFEPLLRRTLREDIAITYLLAPSVPPVRGDSGQLEQVIMNLAVNAQDAMPEGGSLAIETAVTTLDETSAFVAPDFAAGSYVMLTFRDTGQGMDVETQARLFEPFFTTKELGKGTGLGLATTHGIVRQHDGHIRIQSEPGKGTTCQVFLPVADQAVVQAVRLTGGTIGTRGDETILLVEDHDMVRDIARDILQKEGYTVLLATNGSEALKMLESHPGHLHLLLTDVVMPEMSGRELAVLATEKRAGLKVLHMSGYTDTDIAHRGVLDEGVHFIQKPFTAQALAARVREVLGHDPASRT